MTAKPHGSATRASRRTQRRILPSDGTISGEIRRPLGRRRASISEAAIPVTPDQRETDPQCAASRVQGSAEMLH